MSFKKYDNVVRGRQFMESQWVVCVRALSKNDKVLRAGHVILGKSIYFQESQFLHI